MKIVLFGKIRSGKDTVGKILIEKYRFKRFAFGDEIGNIIETYFPKAYINGKPRHHYQFIGQKFRELDEDVWINAVLSKVDRHETYLCFKNVVIKRDPILSHSLGEYENNVVVTDGRQKNEEIKMRKAGYVIVKVVADEEIRIKRMEEAGDNYRPEMLTHETELQVDEVKADYIIYNNGTMEDLENAVDLLVKSAKERESRG